MYVGKAKNLRNRISSYFHSKLGDKTNLMVSQIDKIKTINVESEIESLLLEANLIQKYLPKYNIRFADNKAYPFIRITIKDKYPKVLISRRKDDKKSLYFGPYPNTGALRSVLKLSRKIFPFQSVLNHQKKLCFYNHLGLCPCPEVTNDKLYKKNILHLIDFLKGNTKKIIKDLEDERNLASNSQNYEKASSAQKKIDAIAIVTSSFYRPFDYEENLNLREDVRKKELISLQEVLKINEVKISLPKRIECYDISIISGMFATGSLVVFTNGEKDTKWYRRFKIKKIFGKNNDFAMMHEVLTRRLKHTEWPMPDLLIVDGGKGQVSVASKVLDERNFKIPLIGLAKREEIIVTTDFREIKLSKNSDALHLLMRIRDEAHRFAITYHRKLRSKFLTA